MTEPSPEHVRSWNEVTGPRRLRFQERLDRELAGAVWALL